MPIKLHSSEKEEWRVGSRFKVLKFRCSFVHQSSAAYYWMKKGSSRFQINYSLVPNSLLLMTLYHFLSRCHTRGIVRCNLARLRDLLREISLQKHYLGWMLSHHCNVTDVHYNNPLSYKMCTTYLTCPITKFENIRWIHSLVYYAQ